MSKQFQVTNISPSPLDIDGQTLMNGETAHLAKSSRLETLIARRQVQVVEAIQIPSVTVSAVPREEQERSLNSEINSPPAIPPRTNSKDK